MKISFAFFALVVLIPIHSSAEIYNCDGAWSNLPCSELGKEIPKKSLSKEEQELSKERSKKESLLHDLRMKQIAAKRDQGVDLSIALAEETCQSKSLEDCLEIVDSLDDRIAKRVREAALVAETKRANDIKELEASKEDNEVVINRPQDYIYVVNPERLNGGNRRRHRNTGHRNTGHRSTAQTSTGISVNLGGQVGGRNGSVSGSFSSSANTKVRSGTTKIRSGTTQVIRGTAVDSN